MAKNKPWGDKFREFYSRKYKSLNVLAAALAKIEPALGYASSTLSRFQNGERVPHEIEAQLDLIQAFASLGVITHSAEANSWLRSANFRNLDQDERRKFFPQEVAEAERLLQLPEKPADFVGREEDVRWLERQLTHPREDLIVRLSGLAGVGKTSLAIYVAHKLANRFPDGVLWAHLYDTTPEEILRRFAARFGRDQEVIDALTLTEKAALVQQALASKKVLIVLDGADDNEQRQVNWFELIKWLIPSGERNATLLTTQNEAILRYIEEESPGRMVHRRVQPFDEEAGLALLKHRLGADRVQQQEAAARQTIKLVGGQPLALSIAAGFLDEEKDLSITIYNRQLEDEEKRLELLKDWNQKETRNVAKSFSLSYERLPNQGKELFLLLTLFDGPDFSLEAVSAAADIDSEFAGRLLERLCVRSLVEGGLAQYKHLPLDQAKDQIRYRLHSLLRGFGKTMLKQDAQIKDKLKPAYRRAATYFAQYAAQNGKNAYTRLDSDWQNIIGGVKWAYESHEWQLLLQGVQGLTQPDLGVLGFMDARGHWSEARTILDWAWQGVQAESDPPLEGAILVKLGVFAQKQAKFERAERYLQQAQALLANHPLSLGMLAYQAYLYDALAQLEMQREPQKAIMRLKEGLGALATADIPEKGYLYIRLSSLFGRTGNLDEAEKAAQKGLTLLPAAPNTAKIRVLINLSNIANMRGDNETSKTYLQEGIKLAQKLGHNRLLATLWRNMSEEGISGSFTASIDYSKRALDYYQAMGDLDGVGHVHSNLAWFYTRLGEDETALTHVTKALKLADDYGLEELAAVAKINLATLQIYNGQYNKAIQGLTEAREICDRLDLPHFLPELLGWQAEIALHNDQVKAALALIDEALKIAEEGKFSLEAGLAWRVKGTILSAAGRTEGAETAFQASLALLAEQSAYELARTKAALAQHRRAHESELAPATGRLLAEARATFEAFEARRDLVLLGD